MEFTWELLNDYAIKITSKEIKMNDYQRMKLQDYVYGLGLGPASAIFELATDDTTRIYQVALLKQLEKKCNLDEEQKKIFDLFIKENDHKRSKPMFWAWEYEIYNGKKMMSSNNEYCGYLRSFYSKAEREEECRYTHDEQVGPLTITLKTEPITAAQAYKALLSDNGLPEEFLRHKYWTETVEDRTMTLPELLNLWRSTCIDLKL